MTAAELWAVVKPKAVGPQAIAAALLPLLSQISFSSTSAVWSQPAAGHYAAANAILDSTAARQHSAGLPATTVQFGPFAGTGIAANHSAALGAIGLQTLQPEEARLLLIFRSMCSAKIILCVCRLKLTLVPHG